MHCVSTWVPVLVNVPDSASVFVDILIDFDKYGEFDKYWGSETGKLFYAIRTTYIIAVYGKR